MTVAIRKLRGRAPLTMYRGADGSPGGHLYRGSILDPRLVDERDRDRLIGDGFVEWVVPDGESWKLAEDTDAAEAGASVSVGDTGLVDPNEVDNGTINTVAEPLADPETEGKRAAARQKLVEIGGVPDGRHSKEVLVEFLVGKGYDRETVEASDKADLVALLKAA